jgi:hypothetical protein
MKPFDTTIAALGCLLASAGHAATATGLSSFEGIEEPLVKYYPATGRFERDGFKNIIDAGQGTFRMTARFNPEWWDGDRDTENKDRQRAEVKGLGPHQKHGDTFVYATTWRTNPTFRASGGFCHIFQLKATNGDSGMPLITLSLRGDKASVEANPAGAKIVAREFPWKPNTWQTVRIRVKTTGDNTGEVQVSVDGDRFEGKTGVPLSRPGSDEYRPKWGLYRRAAVNAALGDDFVEHKDVSALNAAAKPADNRALENEARAMVRAKSERAALDWLGHKPATFTRDLAIAAIAALWAEHDPGAAMAWAERLPASPLAVEAKSRIFSRWVDQDVTAAQKWLHLAAPDPGLDQMVWLFVTDTTYRYVNRPIALAAAPLIVDRELRRQAFEHVLEIWARADREAALQFLDAMASLAAEDKVVLRTKLQPPAAKPAPAPVAAEQRQPLIRRGR